MSSKNKTTATKDEAAPALVPKLRFPAFRGTEGWKEKRLGNEGEFLSSLTGKVGGDFDVGEARFVTYMNVFSNTFVDPKALRLVDVKEGENQNAVASGDVFFTISSETPEEVGMSSVLLEDLENCYLNSFCALFRFSKSKRPNPVFTGYLLRQPLVRDYFTKKAQGSTRFNLSKDAFRSLPFFVPSPAEQQKIAECLSSVDDLMAAQARKVDALKTHKKGLMQQLFPREGETQPRLRFPEFQNAGEWEERLLESFIAEFRGKSTIQDEYEVMTSARSGLVRQRDYYDNDRITERDNIGFNVIPPNYMTYRSRSDDRQFYFNENNLGITGIVSVYYPVFRVINGSNKFLIELLAAFSRVVGKYSVGTSQTVLSLNQLGRIRLPFPPTEKEQQRIASCLSSLDALITLETQKLEALKTHKKGLMQQLFPSPEEVEA
ncbi:MAG: restriction endonuclease subunit S [Thiobacillus sp.]|nr:restriction endonuclease subunit S [Thiobacillus sp.]